MNFNLLLWLLIVSSVLFSNPSVGWSQDKISSFGKLLLNRTEKALAKSENGNINFTDREIKQFGIQKTSQNTYQIKALIKTDGQLTKEAIEKLGIILGTQTGNIWTATIPVIKLKELINLPGIVYVEPNVPAKKKLDKARADIGADLVFSGTGIPRAITGKDVIVGVIDGGFDYLHPAFKTQDGSSLRIKRVWNQNDNRGTPPTGYTNGSEYKTPTEILNAEFDSEFGGSHGTHVASIAAGSGFKATQYRGIAPDAELVLVGFDIMSNPVPEAAAYIFDYATSVSKPCVINMSLGIHIGPHDGTSLTDVLFDSLVSAQPGRVLVGSAGNEGDYKLYLKNKFSADNQTIKTLVEFDNEEGIGFIDLWGNAGSTFEVKVMTLTRSGTIKEESNFFSSNNSNIESINLGDVAVDIAFTASSPLNGKPNIQISISDAIDTYVGISIRANNGTTVEAWNHGSGTGANFSNQIEGNNLADFVAGTNASTIGEVGGTGKNVITVGAYHIRTAWTSLSGTSESHDGTIGDITGFSSRGPTADGRIKPDITAPGSYIAAAISRLDDQMTEDMLIAPEISDGGKNFNFGLMEGTSMSAPVVTGVVALMLEANPNLTYEQVHTILQNTAKADEFATVSATSPNNIWGAGKVNALEAVKAVLMTTNTEKELITGQGFKLYPNPVTDGKIQVATFLNSSEKVSIVLENTAGQIIQEFGFDNMAAGFFQKELSLHHIPAGVYVCRLIVGNKPASTQRIAKICR
jgi:subtilisin family serine protease